MRNRTVENMGSSPIVLRDSETENVYRLHDLRMVNDNLGKGLKTRADIPDDEWQRISKSPIVQTMLTKPDARTGRPLLRVG